MPEGIVRTAEEDGGIWVLPVTADFDPDGPTACDWGAGDPW